MARKLLVLIFLAGLLLGLVSPIFAVDKVKLGSSVRVAPPYYLTVLLAEERGIWKANGLEVEWVPFAGGTPHMHAFAAGAVNIGLVSADLPLLAGERGLPVIMIAELAARQTFDIYVRADSPIRRVTDLRGTKIGVPTLGSASHVYARIITKAEGLEKAVRFVGAGGIPEQVAGLKAGAFEAVGATGPSIAGVVAAKEVRMVASAFDYLPKPWYEQLVLARKDYIRAQPDTTRRMVKAIVEVVDYIRKNPRATMDKIKSSQGFTEEAAKLIYDALIWTTTGRFDRKAVENVRRVFIESGIVTEKTPPVDDLFTNEYVP